MKQSSGQSRPNTETTLDLSRLSDEASKQLDYWCHFCGRTQGQVERLIAGQGVYICEVCTAKNLSAKVPTGVQGMIVELPLAQPVDRPHPGYFLDAVMLGVGDARRDATDAPKAVPESHAEREARISRMESSVPRRCSFCGKSQQQVRALFYAGFSFICDECVHLCGEIIEEERAAAGEVAS